MTIFGHVSAILEDFLTDLGGCDFLFYFMTFIPKSHILAKKWIFQHFLHILAILKVFLTKKEKMNKIKKLFLDHTYLECGLCFFIFRKERLQKVKKLTKK